MTMFSLNYLLKHPLSKCSTLWIRASTYKFGGAWSRSSCPPLRRPLSASPCHSGPQPLWLFLSQGLQTFCSFCLQCSFPRIPHGFLLLTILVLLKEPSLSPWWMWHTLHPTSPSMVPLARHSSALEFIYLFVVVVFISLWVESLSVWCMVLSPAQEKFLAHFLPAGRQTDSRLSGKVLVPGPSLFLQLSVPGPPDTLIWTELPAIS